MRTDDIAAVERLSQRFVPSGENEAWRARLRGIARGDAGGSVTLVAVDDAARDEVLGYLAGEIRAFEFGSEPAGWIFAIGVAHENQRRGIGQKLREAAVSAF